MRTQNQKPIGRGMALFLSLAIGFTSTGLFAGPPGGDECNDVVYWVSTNIDNAKKGDTILSTSNTGVAHSILSTMGQQFVHVGKFVARGDLIRHNTMFPELIGLEKNWAGLVRKFKPDDLENGRPGIILDSADQAFGIRDSNHKSGKETSFYFGGAVLLTGQGSSHDSINVQTANKFSDMEGYYRVYSYSDINQMPDSPNKVKGKGNMCSGSVYLAHKYSNNPLRGPQTYSSSVRRRAAYSLYSYLYDKIKNQKSEFAYLINDLFMHQYTVADMSNQIVNCFARNWCGATGKDWHSESWVGSGNTVSPDNLLPMSHVNSHGEKPGLQTSMSAHAVVKPIVKSGGYWKRVKPPECEWPPRR
jgi:hypothetical protein